MQLQSSALWWRDSTLDISAGFQPNQSSTQYTASTHPDKTASTHPDRACYQQKAAMAATHFFLVQKWSFLLAKMKQRATGGMSAALSLASALHGRPMLLASWQVGTEIHHDSPTLSCEMSPITSNNYIKVLLKVISWLYHGYIMLYHGYIMVISWLYHGYIMVISCYIMVISWLYHVILMVISWLYHVISWLYHVILMVMSWLNHVISCYIMVISCYIMLY